MKFNRAILRVFDVQAIPGKAEQLKQKLSETSVTVVKGKPGNLGYFFGETVNSAPDKLVFISVWQDMDAIKSVFGEQWQASFLPPGYAELIAFCSIKHIEVNGEWIE